MPSVWWLAGHEVALEARVKDATQAAAVMAIAVVLVGGLSLGRLEHREEVTGAVMLLAIAFSMILLVGRSFAGEVDRGTMERLLLLPVDRSSLYLSKIASTFALGLVVVAFSSASFVALFGVGFGPNPWAFVAILIAALLGLCASGACVSAIAAQSKARESLLPVLMLPLSLPIFLAAVPGAHHALAG